MDPLLPFALTFGMVIAASQQAAVMEQYAARARHPQASVAQPTWCPPPAVDCPAAAAVPVVPSSPARRNSSASRDFAAHWQSFMQPSISRSAPPAAVPAWQR